MLPVDDFKGVESTSQFNINFIEKYNNDSNEGYFLTVDVKYLEKLHDLYSDLLILPERMQIEKVEKLVANLNNRKEHLRLMKTLKQALNHGLVLTKVYRVIKFNQKSNGTLI